MLNYSFFLSRVLKLSSVGVGDVYSAYEQADTLRMKRLDSELQAEVVGGDAGNLTWRMIDVCMSISINILLKSLMQACFFPHPKRNYK